MIAMVGRVSQRVVSTGQPIRRIVPVVRGIVALVSYDRATPGEIVTKTDERKVGMRDLVEPPGGIVAVFGEMIERVLYFRNSAAIIVLKRGDVAVGIFSFGQIAV